MENQKNYWMRTRFGTPPRKAAEPMTPALTLLFVLFLYGPPRAQDLPPAILADQYLLEATEAMEQGALQKAERAFKKIEALEVEPPPPFAYFYGKLLAEHGVGPEVWRKGQALLKQFVLSAGRESEYYTPTLKLLSMVEAKLEAERRAQADDAAYAAAAAQDTPEGYEEYLRAYPTGRHAARARQRPEERQAQADEAAYAEAQRVDTVEAYGAYLAAYPAGGHAQEARERQVRLQWPVGQTFRDALRSGGQGPEMVVVPAGSFLMGCVSGHDCDDDEQPVHRVTIAQPFAVGQYEVTFAEWDACVAGGGCQGYRPDDEGWGRGRRPVINVRWKAAQAYVTWLSAQTGQQYHLLSEAEWEYVARAETTTQYNWGDSIGRNRANCSTCGSQWGGVIFGQTAPVGSFEANTFGLYDVHGNVEEWVQDCWNKRYAGAPRDGRAWESGDCSRRVQRGGSWNHIPRGLRSATRYGIAADERDDRVGFRIARSLP